MRKYIFIYVLVCLSAYVNAQNITISTEVTSHDERAVVDYSDMKCATEGATVIYKIKVEGCDSIAEVSVCKYVFNNREYEASYTLEKGTITINDLTPTLDVGGNELSFNLTINEKGKATPTVLSNKATIVQIYPVPTYQEVTTPLYFVFCEKTGDLVWSATGEGGAKWEYTWTSTEGTAGNSAIFKHPSITNNGTNEKDITVELKATNYAPDGTTVWDSYSGNWTIKIWPATTVTPNVMPNSEEAPNKKFQGDSWNLSVSASGGYSDGWKIEWLDGNSSGSPLGQGPEYKVTSSAVESIVTKHIIAHVTNSAPEGADQGKELWYDESYHYYIRFYPVPEVKFAESYRQHVMAGEVIQMGVEVVGTEMTSDYIFNCEWEGQTSTSYQYKVPERSNVYGTQEKVTVKYWFGLSNSDVKSETRELTHNFTVWPKPSVNPTAQNSSSDPYRLFQNGKLELSVNPSGGYRTGWSYEWKNVNGDVLGSNDKYTLTCDKTSDEIQEKHVILTVRNQPQGQSDVWLVETYHYYANFYPAPVVKFEKEYPMNIQDDDQISFALVVQDAHGNSAGDAYSMSYSWKNTMNNEESESASYNILGKNPNNDNGVNVTVTVNCTVQLKGQNVRQTYSLQANFIVWPKPTVDATGISDRVGCGGQSMDFSVIANGGKKDGWLYEWSMNDQRLDVSSNYLDLNLDDVPSEDLYKFKVRVVNTCDGEVWYDETYPFNVTVYPKPRIPEGVVVMDVNRGIEVSSGIREGNRLTLHCDECTGGYPDGWSYKWMRNNSELGSHKEMDVTVNSGYSGNGKASDLLIEYSCEVENLYNAVPWMQQTYKKEIRVYRKPQTPTSLRKKGNGASGTWVATFEMDDASLGANDYYLVFGYRDTNGNMHDIKSISQQNAGEQRWSVIDYTEGRNNAYVYALWKYDDGAEVTSGLCLESHVEEDWDGSTYNGVTRSVIADATGINILPSISVGSDGSECYTIDGQKSSHMKKGLNIIRRNDGQFVKVVNNR